MYKSDPKSDFIKIILKKVIAKGIAKTNLKRISEVAKIIANSPIDNMIKISRLYLMHLGRRIRDGNN